MVAQNLRREARIDACIKVAVVRGKNLISLETSDVSFKGLFLRMADPPAVRSLMRLRVHLPVRAIEAHAMAVHIASESDDLRFPGVGLQFWGLAGPDRIAWDDFVSDLIQTRRAAAKQLIRNTPISVEAPTSGVRPAPSEIPTTARSSAQNKS